MFLFWRHGITRSERRTLFGKKCDPVRSKMGRNMAQVRGPKGGKIRVITEVPSRY